MAAPRSNLERAFRRAVADLQALEVRFALVGGLAVGLVAEPRTTRDIDFLIDAGADAAAEALIFSLRQRGYETEAVLARREDGALSTVRLRPPRFPTVLVDLLFDATRVEADVVGRAVSMEVFPGVRARVVTATDLLAMKVKAGRPRDLADIEHLLAALLPGELRSAEGVLRAMERGGAAPGRRLVRELRALVRLAAARSPGRGSR